MLRPGIAMSGYNLRGALLLVALAVAGLLLSCSSEVTPPQRVIMVGIDAADLGVMRDLLDEGKLPNFSRLMTQGATGRLETFVPLRKSPILWTSIATSKLPDEHGIGGFVKPDDRGESIPFTVNVRRAKAIWNILSEAGMRVGVVGWMVTWPAEPVNGYMVTDYIQYETDNRIKFEKQTYPDDLFEEIDALRLTRSDMTDDTVAHLFPVEKTGVVEGVAEWQEDYVKMIFATDETFRRVAHHLDGKGVDFLTVYFNGIDSMCHNFWDQRKHKSHPLSEVIHNYYIWIDGVLGEFMDMVDDETLLVVCSDHGFHGPRRQPDGGILLGIYMHGEYGMISFMGKGVRKGAGIVDADILDITPTILYALGIPVGRDMHGRVLTDAFEVDYLKGRTISYVPTHETGELTGGEPVQSPVDEQVKDKLKAIGYLQ
jgi:predicted AlkP superfamily phosphohydrolase/phosphomutase